MINALQMLRDFEAQDREAGERSQQRGLQNQMLRFQFAQQQQQAARERQRQNMLAQAVASGNPNALMMADPKLGFQMQQMRSREQLGRDRIAAQERIAGQRQQQPQWDASRGVWVQPPPMGGAGVMPGIAAGVVRPQGLPESANERKAREEAEKEQKRLGGAVNKADIVIGKVGEALGQTGFFTTGLTGEMLGKVPGTSAYDLGKTLDTIKANIGFKELQDMREASPTGGALGQVAVQELNFLQAALANLDRGQSEAQLRSNLSAVKKHFENWKKIVQQSGGPQGASPAATGGIDMNAIEAELARRQGKQ